MTTELKTETKPEVQLVEFFSEHWYKINLETGIEYFPSITTKLGIIDKPFLRSWYGDLGNREASYRMKEAGERGSNIHHAWFVGTTGGAVLYQPRKKPNYTKDQIEGFFEEHAGHICILTEQDEQLDVLKLKRWHDELKPEYVANEVITYSIKNKEAGTCDKIIKVLADGFYSINGAKPLFLKAGLYVVDLKTGKQVSDESYMQISAYKENVIEMGMFQREDFSGGLIVHTGASTRSGIYGLATLLRTNEELDQDYTDYRHASNLWLRKNKDLRPQTFEFPSLIKIA